MAGEVRVLDPGLLTTVQDADGRTGLGRFGIPPGGAMDAPAARLANRLVGNRGGEPVLEITLHGPVLEWGSGAHVGLAGADLAASSEHLRLAPGHSYRVRAGAVMSFGVRPTTGRGARAYLAVEGGFDIAPVLGSVSTDRRTGFGGVAGRGLIAGDVIRYAASQGGHLRSLVTDGRDESGSDPRSVRVIPIQSTFGWFDAAAIGVLEATDWRIATDADRTGIRLTGAHLTALTTGIPSLGVPVGSVQVPPSGEPIVTMVDGPVTGGYPVIGVVPRTDHARLAQFVPGEIVRFRTISIEAARAAASGSDQDGDHDRIEVDPGDVGAGWAG
jgi:antagonist of KipI